MGKLFLSVNFINLQRCMKITKIFIKLRIQTFSSFLSLNLLLKIKIKYSLKGNQQYFNCNCQWFKKNMQARTREAVEK